MAVTSTYLKLSREKQTAILHAAVRVFANEGYHAAGVAKICEEAGISNGALYKYFENKESIYEAVFDHVTDKIFAFVFRDAEPKGDIFEQIDAVARRSLDFVRQNRNDWIIYMDQTSATLNRFSDSLAKKGVEQRVRDYWVDLVRKAKRDGAISGSIDEKVAAYVIDTNIVLFVSTLISAQFQHRFAVYFGTVSAESGGRKKLRILNETIRAYLRADELEEA